MSEEISSSTKATPTMQATPILGASEAKDDPNLRKNKSLLAICKKFLEFYPLDLPPGTNTDIPLEVLAEKLNLSRRRLYDIINVMESLQMAVKVTKNLYRWYGLRNVKKLLDQLKQLSDQNRLQELDNLDPGYLSSDLPITPCETESPRLKESPEPKGPLTWKNKSLGGTCLKFLTLFFKKETVSLDWAGRVLLCGEDEDNADNKSDGDADTTKQLRNKIRRIYDVANVLTAVGLVCKLPPKECTRRRLFYGYCGPVIDNLHSGEKVYVPSAEPTGAGRRVRNTLAVLEPKSGTNSDCKRKLVLFSENDFSVSKKLCKDIGTKELSAFSILLAVAEEERLRLERAASNEVKQEKKDDKEIDLLCTENQLSTKDLEYIENREHCELEGVNGRSALRSLLETNQPPKLVFPDSSSSKSGGQMLRKGQLSIPFRTNGPEIMGKCSSL
ncbi:transcription factor E2F8-like isoform X3 [Cloeon dipterum]|uniref:transcription factor E2F8-like isoform X3 n=1 Tax=Cloeon dipterum TaxID=197152 RepID=UPI003220418A